MTETPKPAWMDNVRGRPEQIEAVTSLCPLTVVSAGAGTGKTHTLSQRFAFLLANDRECAVDEILVLTFTEKAAREMRDRIKSTVTSWSESSSSELPWLRQSVQRIDDACISTIHSFAMKVIRESGLVLNIDPAASLIPKPKEELWWRAFAEALDALSASALSGVLPDDWRQRAEELFADENFAALVTSYSSNSLSMTAKAASEKLGSFGKTPEELWNQSDEELISDIENQSAVFADIWKLWLEDIFPQVRDAIEKTPGTGCFAKLLDVCGRYSGTVRTDAAAREFARELVFEVFARLPGNSRHKTAIENILGHSITEWRNEAKESLALAKYPSDAEQKLSLLLNRVCALGWRCWDELRQNDGVLTHNDLIRCAGEVLQKSPDFGLRFKHILIDEFQDTDGLQDRLLRALWREGQNTLFVVGDVKQSIYRFRHANLAIFQRYIDRARSCTDCSCRYITLDRSFRTRDELLSDFNAVFGRMWRGGIEKGSSMFYEPLSGPDDKDWAARNEEPIEPVFESLVSVQRREERPDGKWVNPEKIYDVRIRLFRRLAAKTADIRASGAVVWDKELKGFRPVCWKDFAVLVPSRSVYTVIERAFSEIGVPYVLCTSKNYFNRGEVADIVNLVSLLAEPENALCRAGWLASPFSGPESELDGEIARLRAIAEYQGAARAIMSVMESPRALAAFEPEQRRRVSADIACLADIAAEYEASQGASLAGCADYMRMAVNQAADQEEPDVTDEDQDAVNVLTIHSSKGLEYPIVILTGTEELQGGVPSLCSSVRYGVVANKLPEFLLPEGGKEAATVRGAWNSHTEELAGRAERERFWYVAATRARDKLILCGIQKRNDKNEVVPPPEESFLGHVLAANGEERGLCEVTLLQEDEKYKYLKEETDNLPGTQLELKIVSPAKLARLSASTYAMLAWCPTAYRIAYRQGRNMQWAAKGGDGGGADFGTLAHWVLSVWDFDKASIDTLLPERDSPDYESALRRVRFGLRDKFRSDRARAELRAMLSRFAESGEGKHLASLVSASKDAVERETPFRVQDGGLLLVGATDIFWNDEDGLHLRDWKTTEEELAPDEYYEAQLMFYSYALWKYRGVSSLDVRINYLRTDGPENKPLQIDEAKLAEAGESIHKAAETALSGAFIKRTDRCERCPWRRDCERA